MRHRHLAAAVAAFIGFYGAAVPTAQAAIVTTPSGLRAGGSVLGTCIASNDPPGTALWRRTSVTCPTTSTGITTDYPRSGGGSAWLNSAVNAGKADWTYERARASPLGRLADLTGASYEWLRDSSSTAPAHLHPVFRIILDADGDPSTTNDTQSLVFERAYNGGGAVPTNSWQSETLGGATHLWVTKPGTGGNENAFGWTLDDFKNGTYVPTGTFRPITGNSLVLGVTFGIGSGWTSAFRGAVDNVAIQMNGAPALSANFEVDPLVATLQCAPTALDDSAGNQSICTVSLNGPASASGLVVALTPPATPHARYSTTCGNSIAVAAFASSATCTITAEANTTPGDGAAVATLALAAPAAGGEYVLGATTTASVTVQDDDLFTANLVCAPTALTDSVGQLSTCTVSLNAPAPAGGLVLGLTPPVASGRYTTDCGSSIAVPAGATQASCNVTATANTTPGDGDVVANLALMAGAGYTLGPNASAAITIANDDSALPQPVPTLGVWSLLLMSLGLSGLAWRRRRAV